MNEQKPRELDAWIAEHVMEFVVNRNAHGNLIAIDFNGDRFTIEHVYGVTGNTFNPSTDPAAAMMVLEKCIEGGRCVAMDKDKAGNFNVTSIDRECNGVFMVHAFTLPLAISLFAKKLFSK
jgi:hypothetical protein